jgi:hypothetical protein
VSPRAPGDAGRDDELAQIAAVLQRRRAGVVAVTGPQDSGKSYVTAHAVAAAAAEGWRVTPYVGGRGVRVGTSTTATELLESVAGALRLRVPAPEPSRRALHPLARLARLLRDEAAKAPVLVVLDPFQPAPELLADLRHELLPALRGGAEPVVLLAVARRPLTDELRADVEVHVRRPGADAIESAIRWAAAGVVPPLEEAELATYVRAAADNPRLLTSLEALLPLSRPGAGRELTEAAASTGDR